MSQPASRVIGIIRITESSEFGVDLKLRGDDSNLGSLLASLVGKRSPGRAEHCCRWEPAAPMHPRGERRKLPANLPALREQLEREYVALTAG